MLTVEALMTVAPEAVGPEDTLHTVLAKMNGGGCRHLPVVENERVIGIITERDVRLAVGAPTLSGEIEESRRAALDEVIAAEIMTSDPLTARPGDSARAVADLLCLHKYGAVPVVEDGELVGILTVVDYLRWFASGGESAAEAVAAGGAPSA